ncbi:DUF2752 domain-containing protein [Allomuricauda sp. d1]|uniref:DUF2752 domain-containing protein n=1 Tax=Allomuricauda sp. d1 TaxID=3136725 RepID=UPI0031E0775C
MNIFQTIVLSSTKEYYMMPCVNKQLTGFDCPGCGIQRSIVHLINGEFIAAFKIFPAIYFLIFLAGFLLFNKLYSTKYANQIIIALSIASVATILINFFYKLLQ